MGIKEICKPWDDVFDTSFDEHLAPELGNLFSEEKTIYTNPYEFFSRTYLTDSILESLENIIEVIKGEGGNNTFTIYSLFGGGKTHSLLAIYHAIKKPKLLAHEDILKGYDEVRKKRIRRIAEEIDKLEAPQIVVIYGKDYALSGRPLTPIEAGGYKIYTVWGYLAHSLGRYDCVKENDRALTVPDVGSLRKIIEDKPTVILIDEIVDYAYGLKGSRMKEEKEYVDSIPQFLDRLVSAVLGTRTALIVTLPIEAKGMNLEKTESWYEKDFVKKYWIALHRTGAKDLPALKIGTEEIIDVIKKRNFKYIDEIEAEGVIRNFEEIYRQNKDEVFGSFEETIRKMRKTFPYHPDLIEILMDIIEKAGLQRTRDMLKLTRKIIRKVWKSESDPQIIMPWHIDLASDLFHADLFRNETLAVYSAVARRDIKEGAERFDIPELAKKISTVIFLKTYIYDSPTPQTHFPTAFDISKMVYEQDFFVKNKLTPPQIIDILEQMESKAYMHHLQVKDGRYWFWQIASVKEQVESEKRRLMDEEREEVEIKLADIVGRLIKGEASGKRRRPVGMQKIKVFNQRHAILVRDRYREIEDTPNHKVVFLINEDITLEDCERIMFKYKGSDRTYKNTIVCVYPSSSESYERCLELSALLLACEKVKNDLSELYPNAGEEIIKVQESMIKKILDDAENNLNYWILRTFSKISYPSAGEDKTKPKAEIAEASEGEASTLLEQAFLTLVSPQVAKIREELSFDSLKREVKEILGIDITEKASKKVSEIKSWFKTNPAFPMVEDEDIEEAIRDGVRKLYIGIRNDKIWFKKICDENEIDINVGDFPVQLKDSYTVLSWKEAINQQVKKLLEEEKTSKDGKTRIKYLIRYENHLYPVEKIIEEKEWEEIVRESSIIRKKEEISLKRDFKITLLPDSMKVKQGEEIEVKVRVEPVAGVEDTFIKIYPELGEIAPSEGKPPLECTWKLRVPLESGIKSVKIKIESEDQEKTEFLLLHVEGEIISTSKIEERHKGMLLFEVSRMGDIELLKELNALAKERITVEGEAKIESEGKGAKLFVKNLEGDVTDYLLSQIKDFIEGNMEMELTVHIRDGIKIDDVVFHKLSIYDGKAEFKLRKQSKE